LAYSIYSQKREFTQYEKIYCPPFEKKEEIPGATNGFIILEKM
jgi:hypothetical protein